MATKTTYYFSYLVCSDGYVLVLNPRPGIEIKFKNQSYPLLVSSCHVPELTTVEDTDLGLRVGGSVTLAQLDRELKRRTRALPGRPFLLQVMPGYCNYLNTIIFSFREIIMMHWVVLVFLPHC